MPSEIPQPEFFDVLRGQARQIRDTPYGAVGTIYEDENVEAVWVSKQDEAIDPEWFSQGTVDLIIVVQGQLRVEFADSGLADMTIHPGGALVLPPNVPCRAYRWPRDAAQGTIFVAVYPKAKQVMGAYGRH